jgi:hypothetical protein
MAILSVGAVAGVGVALARQPMQMDPGASAGTGSGDPQAIARPKDVESWITVGTTLRMSRADPAAPEQFRHIQVEPGAYRALTANGRLPDGAVLAATLYAARRSETETPTMYAEDKEAGFLIEVLDKRHPDGRRFYVFKPGATSVAPLPAGNACAVCHNAKGALQGTFAQYYPLAAKYAPAAASGAATFP